MPFPARFRNLIAENVREIRDDRGDAACCSLKPELGNAGNAAVSVIEIIFPVVSTTNETGTDDADKIFDTFATYILFGGHTYARIADVRAFDTARHH